MSASPVNAPVPKSVSTRDLCDLSPAYVRAIAPYQPGKPTSELAREMGIEEKGIVKLASNENPRGIGPRTRAAIESALGELARYPDGNGFELKDALSRRYGVGKESIVLGNGSNDVLELVAMAFLGAGSSARNLRATAKGNPNEHFEHALADEFDAGRRARSGPCCPHRRLGVEIA